MKRRVTTDLAIEILRLRAVKTDWGEPRYSLEEIGGKMGLSASTVARVAGRQGTYRTLPNEEELQLIVERNRVSQLSEAEQQAAMEKRAAESEKLFLDMVAGKAPVNPVALDDLTPEQRENQKKVHAYLYGEKDEIPAEPEPPVDGLTEIPGAGYDDE